MITKMIGEEEGDIIQIGAILAMLAVIDGAKIVRVHDVEETIRVLKILEYLESK
jgi:dihydropteroate synthase